MAADDAAQPHPAHRVRSMTVPVPVRVSELLQTAIDDLGEPARRWLAELPNHLADVAKAWDLRLQDQLDHIGWCAVVYPVTTADGNEAILKATVPHDEAAGEATALRQWDGDGAARLLRASDDGFTLLLERCVPGHDLWTVPIDEQIDVVAELLPRLWGEPPSDERVTDLSDAVERWLRRMHDNPGSHDLPAEVVRCGAAWAEELTADPGPRVLLHGDLNPGNVLAATRDPWLAIDPKPFAGEPTFDLAQLLLNWAWGNGDHSDDQPKRVVKWAGRLTEALDLDRDRALQWALVKGIGWDGGRDDLLTLHAAATSAIGSG